MVTTVRAKMREHPVVRAATRAGRTHHSRRHSETFASFRGIRVTVPVTLCLIVAHLLIFLIPGPIRRLLPSSTGVCDSPSHGGMVKNLLFSTIATFLHARVSHLIYDVALLLGSGLFLEPSMGSLCFAISLPILEVFSQWLRFVVDSQLETIFSPLNTSKCVVGCSATLFALKVILDNHSHMYSMPGLPVLFRMSTWMGLFALYASVPETSAIGHACGILAGYVYVRLNSGCGIFRIGAVLIRQLLSNVSVALGNLSTCISNRWFEYQNGCFRREDTNSIIGTEYAGTDILEWSCPSCSRKNGVFLSFCDFCGTPRSLIDQYVPSAPLWQDDNR